MLRPISSLGICFALAACGGGGGKSQPPPPPPVAISGTVSGLAGTGLKLRFTASTSADLAVGSNGAFTGPLFKRGDAYTVTVRDQPTQPWQTCTVTNGTGTLNGPVNNVAVTCTTNNYRLGGTVTGLTGANFTLRLNGGAATPVFFDGAFGFDADLASGTNYTVTIATLPDGQACTLANATGQVAGASISNVSVICSADAFSSIVRTFTPALDLAYNPASGELYVSTETQDTGPAIAIVDPLTGDTLRTVPTTTRAAPLTVSEDGQFLYAGMGATGNIRRYALPALTSDLEFSIGVDHTGQPLEAYDIRVAPGNARTVAVTRTYAQEVPRGYGLAVFDDGVMRPDTIGDAMPAASAQPDGALWSPDGTKLFSLGPLTSAPRYYHSAVSASGVTLQDEIPLPQERSYGFGVVDVRLANRNYQMAGDRLYSATGVVFDPARRAQLGAFRTQGQGFAIDTAGGKAFFASGGFLLPITFESFDLTRMTPIASHTVLLAPNATGQVQKLLRWGTDGLAALTSTNQLIIVSGTFVSEPSDVIVQPAGALVESTGTTGAYQYRIYDLPANDVLWDAARERLYASVTGQHRTFGNLIASINVATNHVVGGAGTSSEPTWMSASDDGSRLYVTHYASSSVSRIDLTTLRPLTTFLLNYPGQGPGYALAAEPRPGDASTFAYIEHYPAVSTVFTRMISDTTLRPLSFNEPISTMAFVNADTLFGNNTWSSTLDLHEIGVIPMGLHLVRSDPNIFNGQPRMTFAGGLLYGDGGFWIDPVTRSIVRTYNPGMSGASKAFRANPARDRGYMAFEDSGSVPQLMVFRLSDGSLLATVPLPANLESPISLASMDNNGVAVTTTAGKIILVQGPDL